MTRNKGRNSKTPSIETENILNSEACIDMDMDSATESAISISDTPLPPTLTPKPANFIWEPDPFPIFTHNPYSPPTKSNIIPRIARSTTKNLFLSSDVENKVIHNISNYPLYSLKGGIHIYIYI